MASDLEQVIKDKAKAFTIAGEDGPAEGDNIIWYVIASTRSSHPDTWSDIHLILSSLTRGQTSNLS